MGSDKRLKVAQVGVGGFGGHRRWSMRETGLFDLVAAYDWNEKALEACCAQEGAAPASSYEAMLETPGVEAVIVTTGAKFHADQVAKAAEKGFHVFVEKPVCATKEELDALLEVQKRTGVVIASGHNDHRHEAESLKTKELIDSGALGKVATFEKTTAHNGGLLMKPGDWRADPDKNPGGMLFQCGVHALHELMFYFGPIVEVSSMMRHDVHTSQTADVALCHLKFASGLIGTLNAYHVTPYRHTFSVFGTRANLYRDSRFFDEGTTILMQESKLDGHKEPLLPVEVDHGLADPCGNIRSFYHAIRDGAELYPSLLDGLRAVAVVFAAEESARTGRIVQINTELVE